MSTDATKREESRPALGRQSVVRAAIEQADSEGLTAVTMRQVAASLRVAPMALYRHVANREDLIDAMVDALFGEIPLPLASAPWKAAMRDRALSLRDVLARHRWAIGLMESRRRPGPNNLRHHDAVIGTLRSAGFDLAMVAHAYSLLDGYIYGYALTKMNVPFETADEMTAMAHDMFEPFAENAYPNLSEFVAGHVMQAGYDYGQEFEYGLDLILDGLEEAR